MERSVLGKNEIPVISDKEWSCWYFGLVYFHHFIKIMIFCDVTCEVFPSTSTTSSLKACKQEFNMCHSWKYSEISALHFLRHLYRLHHDHPCYHQHLRHHRHLLLLHHDHRCHHRHHHSHRHHRHHLDKDLRSSSVKSWHTVHCEWNRALAANLQWKLPLKLHIGMVVMKIKTMMVTST